MSAVSTPTPTTRMSARATAWRAFSGACSRRSVRVFSISLICCLTKRRRVQVASQLGQRVRRHGGALRRAQGLELPRRLSQRRPEAPNAETGEIGLQSVHDARALFDEDSRRSRLGRLASSSSSAGIAAMLQCFGSPRSQPRKARLSNSVSSRSVFARRCSRDTGTLDGWIT